MMIACRRDKQKGFTLIELLMVAFMLGLVMISLYSLYTSSQRHAYVQEEVADVQQNLRVAMDSITRDVRHAGFMTTEFYNTSFVGRGTINPATNGNSTQTINTALSNVANSTTLPVTRDVITGVTGTHADFLTLNAAAPTITFARLDSKQNWTAGAAFTFTVSTPESVDLFNVDATNPDYVRIIDPVVHKQSTYDANPTVGGTVFRVSNKNRAAQTIELTWVSGNTPVHEYKRNDIIVKIAGAAAPFPTTITYCLGPTTGCPPAGATAVGANQCVQKGPNDQTMCLLRIENNVTQVVASGLSGLQFTYLLDNLNEVPNAVTALPLTDLTPIRAIRVNITGQTATARSLTGTGEHVRTMTSVVKLQNRYMSQ